MAFLTMEYVLSPTKARTCKNFFFEDNSSTFSSSKIEILGKVLRIVKLVNDDVTHYLIKLSKYMSLSIFGIISFFFSRVIKRLCSIAEPLFLIND